MPAWRALRRRYSQAPVFNLWERNERRLLQTIRPVARNSQKRSMREDVDMEMEQCQTTTCNFFQSVVSERVQAQLQRVVSMHAPNGNRCFGWLFRVEVACRTQMAGERDRNKRFRRLCRFFLAMMRPHQAFSAAHSVAFVPLSRMAGANGAESHYRREYSRSEYSTA